MRRFFPAAKECPQRFSSVVPERDPGRTSGRRTSRMAHTERKWMPGVSPRPAARLRRRACRRSTMRRWKTGLETGVPAEVLTPGMRPIRRGMENLAIRTVTAAGILVPEIAAVLVPAAPEEEIPMAPASEIPAPAKASPVPTPLAPARSPCGIKMCSPAW